MLQKFINSYIENKSKYVEYAISNSYQCAWNYSQVGSGKQFVKYSFFPKKQSILSRQSSLF